MMPRRPSSARILLASQGGETASPGSRQSPGSPRPSASLKAARDPLFTREGAEASASPAGAEKAPEQRAGAPLLEPAHDLGPLAAGRLGEEARFVAIDTSGVIHGLDRR